MNCRQSTKERAGGQATYDGADAKGAAGERRTRRTSTPDGDAPRAPSLGRRDLRASRPRGAACRWTRRPGSNGARGDGPAHGVGCRRRRGLRRHVVGPVRGPRAPRTRRSTPHDAARLMGGDPRGRRAAAPANPPRGTRTRTMRTRRTPSVRSRSSSWRTSASSPCRSGSSPTSSSASSAAGDERSSRGFPPSSGLPPDRRSRRRDLLTSSWLDSESDLCDRIRPFRWVDNHC